MNNIHKYLMDKEYKEIIKIEDEYRRAYELVTILFKDKKDLTGAPYLGHLTRVANQVNEEYRPAALLHDTLEDIEEVTAEDLMDFGFSLKTVNIVKLLTNKVPEFYDILPREKRQMLYDEKIATIIESKNFGAISIKRADINDNLSENRLLCLPERTRRYLRNKYKLAKEKLEVEYLKLKK